MNRSVANRSARDAAVTSAVLAVASLPLVVSEARRERNLRLPWLLLAGMALRLGCAVARERATSPLYVGDVDDYHGPGTDLGASIRRGDLRPALQLATGGKLAGTHFVQLAVGTTYAVVGARRVTASQLSAWLSFLGVVWFRRAFVRAVPRGRAADYSRLLLFTPSLLFWPAAIGKDGWLSFSLGLTADGASRVMTGDARPGYRRLGLGLTLTSIVRPHVGAGVAAALSGALVVRARGRRLVSLLVLTSLLAVWTDRYLRRFEISARDGWRAAADRMAALSRAGGSEFKPVPATTPGRAPLAVGTVLFRPHPLEAHNRAALAAALESTLLLALSLRRLRWFAAAIRRAPREPYVVFATGATAVLAALFSSLANFGLLVRQRTQLLPFYFVLLSIPPQERDS